MSCIAEHYAEGYCVVEHSGQVSYVAEHYGQFPSWWNKGQISCMTEHFKVQVSCVMEHLGQVSSVTSDN